LIIILIGFIGFLVFYKEEFEKITIQELINNEKITKGIISGKVEYVVKNFPSTILILNDGSKATIYYPKETTIQKNDFITAYVEKEKENNFYAYKVIKEI